MTHDEGSSDGGRNAKEGVSVRMRRYWFDYVQNTKRQYTPRDGYVDTYWFTLSEALDTLRIPEKNGNTPISITPHIFLNELFHYFLVTYHIFEKS